LARLLLVDDEPGMLFALKELVQSRGHEPVLARSGKEALAQLEGVDAVISDYSMPEFDGLQLLQAVRERDATLPVVMLTAHGSERLAVRAMKAGAWEYVTKPFDIEEMGLVIDRALEARALRVQNRRLSAEKAIGRAIVGESVAMRRVIDAASRVAPRDITVLVRGDTGTGKELVAALIHAESKRARKPLVRFNCAAIPGELAEAELFGHARGAFTGAVTARRGFFAEADGGTLVLDEVGELPLSLQAKLLRALQEGEIQPVGAGRVETVDVRVIACTNRDLLADVRAGRFREDLYYRLAVVELTVPPLHEHREDIPALAAEFTRRYAEKFGVEGARLSVALVHSLQTADWPGNVRQLENAIARLVALSTGGEIGEQQQQSGSAAPALQLSQAAPSEAKVQTLWDQLDAFERGLIEQALEVTRGNQSEAARRLGVSRSAFIDRLKKYGLGG
jgi:DNA-binding NtrC family response regulator